MSDFDFWHSSFVAATVAAANHASAPSLAASQAERLARLVARARRDTRLHAERLRHLDAHAPLAALPVLSKHELMTRFDDSLADPDPDLNLATVRAFAADPTRIGTALLDRYMVWESSGTHGEPGLFVQDPAAMAVYDALEALRPDSSGLRFGERWAFVGAIDGHFASQASVQRLRRLNPFLGASLRSFSILQPLPELVRALNDWSPTVLATYPTAATMLAQAQAGGDLRLSLRELATGGETLGAAQRKRIAQAFDCPVRNSYGASEFLCIAKECAQGCLHVNADWVILEPVDRHGRAVRVGELSHTTLLTNLANAVQPLIRYDMGDRVRMLAAPCACGSALPVIEVQGRCDDALVFAGRAGRDVMLLPLALSTVLEDDAGVFDFQLLQRDDHTVTLRLGADVAAGRGGPVQRCRNVLRAFAQAQGTVPLTVLHEAGVPPARGRSGKVQRVLGLPVREPRAHARPAGRRRSAAGAPSLNR